MLIIFVLDDDFYFPDSQFPQFLSMNDSIEILKISQKLM